MPRTYLGGLALVGRRKQRAVDVPRGVLHKVMTAHSGGYRREYDIAAAIKVCVQQTQAQATVEDMFGHATPRLRSAARTCTRPPKPSSVRAAPPLELPMSHSLTD